VVVDTKVKWPISAPISAMVLIPFKLKVGHHQSLVQPYAAVTFYSCHADDNGFIS